MARGWSTWEQEAGRPCGSHRQPVAGVLAPQGQEPTERGGPAAPHLLIPGAQAQAQLGHLGPTVGSEGHRLASPGPEEGALGSPTGWPGWAARPGSVA